MLQPIRVYSNKGMVMFQALSAFFFLVVLAAWSIAIGALHAVGAWAITHAGELQGGLPAGSLLLPAPLGEWVPVEWTAALTALWSSTLPLVDSILGYVPALAPVLGVFAWVVWAGGALLVVILAVGAAYLIARLQRRGAGGSGPLLGQGRFA